MPRTYKAHRRFAPPVEEILRMRQLGDPMEEIAARHGCHRRTIYGALDRAARRGQLPPVTVPVLFPDSAKAQQRMAKIINGAHRPGLDVWGWEHIAMAKALAQAAPVP
jgi:Homeodomain-like domain